MGFFDFPHFPFTEKKTDEQGHQYQSDYVIDREVGGSISHPIMV